MKAYSASFHDGSIILPDGEYWSFALVEERLVKAMEALWRLPGRIGPQGYGVSALWAQVRREWGDYVDSDDRPRRPGLTRREVAEMEEALGWVDHVPPGDTRRIVAMALFQLAIMERSQVRWTDVFRWLERDGVRGYTTDGLRKRYSRAVTMICNRLNAAEKVGVEAVKP